VGRRQGVRARGQSMRGSHHETSRRSGGGGRGVRRDRGRGGGRRGRRAEPVAGRRQAGHEPVPDHVQLGTVVVRRRGET